MINRAEEIRRELEELQIKRDSIAFQVDEAIMTAKSNGKWADGDWLSSARHAMRITGRKIGALQKELGEINKQKKVENVAQSEERAKIFERQFMYNAKKLLPQVLYEQILYKTIEEIPRERSSND